MPAGKGKKWGADSDLPQMKVRVQSGELRRRENREPPDPVFCYIDEDWNWHRVIIGLMLSEGSPENNLAVQLVDCSETGLSISCTRAVARGAAIGIVGMDAINQRVLFTDQYRVRNVRKRPAKNGNGVARSSQGNDSADGGETASHVEYTFGAVVSKSLVEESDAPTEFVYGLHHEKDASGLLTKALLDSVFLHHLRDEADLDIVDTLIEIKDAIGASGAPDPAA